VGVQGLLISSAAAAAAAAALYAGLKVRRTSAPLTFLLFAFTSPLLCRATHNRVKSAAPQARLAPHPRFLGYVADSLLQAACAVSCAWALARWRRSPCLLRSAVRPSPASTWRC